MRKRRMVCIRCLGILLSATTTLVRFGKLSKSRDPVARACDSIGLRNKGLATPPHASYIRAGDDPGCGEVAEWSNAAVSKTVVGLRRPRVRIPVSPPMDIDFIR
jgi:hypothetical protein